jgi:hypothetical protein
MKMIKILEYDNFSNNEEIFLGLINSPENKM